MARARCQTNARLEIGGQEMQNVNINTILAEVQMLKEQLQAAQTRLATLEALLQASTQVEAQEQRPVQPGPQAPQLQQPVQKPAQQPKTKKEEKFEFRSDPELAIKVLELIASRGELRISTLKWYLSLYHDLRVSEVDVIYVVKDLERLEALKGTWTAPGIVSRSAPVLDPSIGRGPKFSLVRTRLQELTRKWR